jgi:hypothetical protein
VLRREPQQLAILVFTPMLRFNSTKRLLEMETRTPIVADLSCAGR